MELAVTFESLCRQVESHTSLTIKEEIVKGYLERFEEVVIGTVDGATPDLLLVYRLLLPKQAGRLYRLQDKQLIKLLSVLLKVPEATLKDSVNKTGNIGVTAAQYFNIPEGGPKRSKMTLVAFDAHLEALAAVTTEEKQVHLMDKFFKQASSAKEVRLYLEQIKHELRLGASVPVLLGALHPMAYKVYQQCANIAAVVKKVMGGDVAEAEDGGRDSPKRGVSPGHRSPSPVGGRGGAKLTASITLDMPVAPMLAAPSKDVEQVLLKCPNGAFSEVKYDGERIQIHKNGDSFKYFARSLLPVKEDKYEGLEVHIKAATAHLTDAIFDGEILMVDKTTQQPLAFGTLGKHKKAGLAAKANTGLFIFDILYLNGKSLLNEPLDKRRQILTDNLKLIPLRIYLSEKRNVVGTKDQQKKLLDSHLQHAIKEGLEGLVVKDMKGVYAPAQRHWVKMKKDYLAGMADSADMVVLGGNYGSGNKKGQLSIFLMGVLDKKVGATVPGRWKTVVKVGNGHDDAMIVELNKKYKDMMVPCDRRSPPAWLDSKAAHRPDMIWKHAPTDSDVWEIKGAEFSQTKNHTANGISLRFPRIERIRDDKTPATATSLEELTALVEASKDKYTKMHDLPGEDPDAAVNGGDDDDVVDADYTPAITAGGGEGPLSPFADAAANDPPPAATGIKPVARTPSNVSPTATLARQGTVAMAAEVDIAVVNKDVSLSVREASTNGKKGGHVLLHIVAAGGKWIPKGVMGSISKNFGPTPCDDYNGQSRDLTLGKVHVSGAIHPDPKNKSSFVVILSLVAQTLSAKRGQPPTLDHSSLAVGLQKAAKYAMEQGATTHFARPPSDAPPSGIAWPPLQQMLVRHYVNKKLPILVYSRDPALARVGSGAGGAVPASLPAPAGFTSVGASSLSASVPVVPAGGGDDDVLCAVTAFLDPEMPKRESEAVRQKLLMMGATITNEQSKASQVIVGTTVGTTVVSSCGGMQMCLRKEWIDACFAQEKLVDMSTYRLLPAAASTSVGSAQTAGGCAVNRSVTNVFDLLKNCRVVIQGFTGTELSEIQSKVNMMGGTLHDKWTLGRGAAGGPTTHMICGFWCPSAMKATDSGGAVIRRQWLDETFAKGTRQPLDGYYVTEDDDDEVPPPVQRRAPTIAPTTQKPLDGLTFFLERYLPSEGNLLRSRVEALGGTLVPTFTQGSPGLFVLCDQFIDMGYSHGTPLYSATDRSTLLSGRTMLTEVESLLSSPLGALQLKAIFARCEYDRIKKKKDVETDKQDLQSSVPPSTPGRTAKPSHSPDASHPPHSVSATPSKLTGSAKPATVLVAVDDYHQETNPGDRLSNFGNHTVEWDCALTEADFSAGAILKGRTFYIDGYSPKMATFLKSMVTMMGGSVCPVDRGSSPSFYIISDLRTTTTDAVTEPSARGRILSHTFIKDCYQQNALVDTRLYAYDVVRLKAPTTSGAPDIPTSRGKRNRDIVVCDDDDEVDEMPALAAASDPAVKRRQVVTVDCSEDDDDEVEDYVAKAAATTPIVTEFKRRQPLLVETDDDDRTETASSMSDNKSPPPPVANFRRRTGKPKDIVSSGSDTELEDALSAPKPRLQAAQLSSKMFDASKVPTVAPNLLCDYNLVLYFDAGAEPSELVRRYCGMTGANHTDKKWTGGEGKKFTIALVTGSGASCEELAADAKKAAADRQVDAVSERWFWSCVQQNRVLPTSSFLL